MGKVSVKRSQSGSRKTIRVTVQSGKSKIGTTIKIPKK